MLTCDLLTVANLPTGFAVQVGIRDFVKGVQCPDPAGNCSANVKIAIISSDYQTMRVRACVLFYLESTFCALAVLLV